MLSWIDNLIGLSSSVSNKKNKDGKYQQRLNRIFQSRLSYELLRNELPFFLVVGGRLWKEIELYQESKIIDAKDYYVINTFRRATMQIKKKYLNDEIISFICDGKITHLGDKELYKIRIFGDWVHKSAQNATIQTKRDIGYNIYEIIQGKIKKKTE